jgi:hypothetical protein
MFQFPRFPSYTYAFSVRYWPITTSRLPHSDIHGSTLAYSSPWHFGVRPVLLRLLAPRHPPCALSNFTCRSGRSASYDIVTPLALRSRTQNVRSLHRSHRSSSYSRPGRRFRFYISSDHRTRAIAGLNGSHCEPDPTEDAVTQFQIHAAG